MSGRRKKKKRGVRYGTSCHGAAASCSGRPHRKNDKTVSLPESGPPASSSDPEQRSERTPPAGLPPGLALLSVFTFLLCAAVLLIISFREISSLRLENSTLRESRLMLLDRVREGNRRLDSLISGRPRPGSVSDTPRIVIASLPPNRSGSTPAAFSLRTGTGNRTHHLANGPTDLRAVALTFDGGSFANAAEEILDTLAGRSVSATMFLTGEFIRRYPDITRRIAAEGHECGNHLYSHPHLTSYGIDGRNTTLPSVERSSVVRELLRTERLFLDVTGVRLSPLWRAPYGEFNREICAWAAERGYLHVGWRQGKTWRDGLDSNDWVTDSSMPGYHGPPEFLEKTVALARREPCGINGGIVLMHLGTGRREAGERVHRVLGTLIDTLRAEGYRFVRVSEMATAAGIDLALMRERIHIEPVSIDSFKSGASAIPAREGKNDSMRIQ